MQRQPEEDIDDLRKKFHLLEGDRRVFYHASQTAKKNHREQIQQLQKENKELREQLQLKVPFFVFNSTLTDRYFHVKHHRFWRTR